MTNTFVLFALFTVGSAIDVLDCSVSGNDGKACVKDNLVGKCASSSCATASECGAGKKEHDVCGDSATNQVGLCQGENAPCFYTHPCNDPGAYCANDNYIGICSSLSKCNTRKPCHAKDAAEGCGGAGHEGKCKTDEGYCELEKTTVAIQYSVAVPQNARLKYYDKLAQAEYTDEALACFPAEDTTISNGSLKTSSNQDCDKSHFVNGDQCKLTCSAGGIYIEKTPHTRKCMDGVWTGVKGVCAQQCLNLTTSGTFSYDSEKKSGRFATGSSLTPAEGTIDCADTFRGGELCTLSCAPGYRVKTATAVKCQSDGSFSGAKGECEASVDISASASFVLQPGEYLNNVVLAKDKAFNKRFMDSVSELLGTGVLAANVEIVAIKEKAGLRRLNESSVQVDYTLRVPKGDPEGATELADGTQFPKEAGGVLRGIR